MRNITNSVNHQLNTLENIAIHLKFKQIMQDTKIDGKVYSLQLRMTIDVRTNTASSDNKNDDTLYLILVTQDNFIRPGDSCKAMGFDYLIPKTASGRFGEFGN